MMLRPIHTVFTHVAQATVQWQDVAKSAENTRHDYLECDRAAECYVASRPTLYRQECSIFADALIDCLIRQRAYQSHSAAAKAHSSMVTDLPRYGRRAPGLSN